MTRPRQRVVEHRALNVRRWETRAQAWADGADHALDAAWIDHVVDLGSQ